MPPDAGAGRNDSILTRRTLLPRLARLLAVASIVLAGLAALVSPGTVQAAHGPRSHAMASIYVSPSGNDSNPGTFAEPLRTLTRARDVAAKRQYHAQGNVSVYLEAGIYREAQPLSLSRADSGHNGHQVIWRAVPGTAPIISGAIRIGGWVLADSADNIWSATVPAGFDTRQLYINGARAAIASGAVPTQLTQTAGGYTMSTPVMADWRNPADIEFVYTQQLGQMVEPICPIAAITDTTITMAQPCWDNSTRRQIDSVTPWYDANLAGSGSLRLPVYVENAYELLTRPGQFYLDRPEHRLYYIPRPGQNMHTADVEASALQTLLRAVGTPSSPIRDIAFRGITFTGAGWLQPSTVNGFSEIQSGYTLTGDGAYAREGLCKLVRNGSCPYGAWTKEPAAVHFAYDQNISFVNDRFVHLGAAGLDLGDGSQGDLVSTSVFTDISGNGIQVGSVDLANATPTQQTKRVSVINNHVYDIGVEYHGAVGILLGYGADCSIAHNQLDNLPYSAISAGWAGWLDKIGRPALANYSHDNQISYNLIANYMQTLSDGGGIYTQGITGPSLAHGEKVVGNIIHGQVDWSFALHSDDGATNVTYRRNAMYDDTYEWCCNHTDYPKSRYDPQRFMDNYWESGDNSSRVSSVVQRNNHLISGPEDIPAWLQSTAGIQAHSAFILAWSPGALVPQPPDHVAALYTIADTAYITWHASLTGTNEPVVSYTISACAAPDGFAKEPCVDMIPSITIPADQYLQTGYGIISGLTPGEAYWFSVTASNADGSSTPSNPSAVVLADSHPASVPGPPRNVTYHRSQGRLSLRWNAPTSADCTGPYWAGTCANPVLSYEISVSTGATYIISSLSQLIVSNGGGEALTVLGGLQSDQAYTFSIAAITPAGMGAAATTGWVKRSPP